MLRIALVLPDLLGTYGDGGNAEVLAARARARDIDVEVREMMIGARLPDADLYLLGGGEDGPQQLACDLLRDAGFAERYREGAHVFAVCAGLQILGTSFAVAGDATYPGLGLVAATTMRGANRAVGDVLTMVGGRLMVGFENHGGVTTLQGEVRGFGEVIVGRGNDGRVDGFVAPRLRATYAHGPVLAQNPWLADQLLEDVSGRRLPPWPSVADQLYDERCARVSTRRSDATRSSRHH